MTRSDLRFWQKAVIVMLRDCENIREAHTAYRWMQTIGIPLASALGFNETLIRRAAAERYAKALTAMEAKRAVPRKKRRTPFDGTARQPVAYGPRPTRSRLKVTRAQFMQNQKARWASLAAHA